MDRQRPESALIGPSEHLTSNLTVGGATQFKDVAILAVQRVGA